MMINQTQQTLRSIFGNYVNPESEVYINTILRSEEVEWTIAQIKKATAHSPARILVHVQNSVLSYEDTLEYAFYYGELPCDCVAEEIYLMGFEAWHKLNKL